MADCASSASITVHSMDSVVHGHRVCKKNMDQLKEMSCKGEADNIHDMYVVAMIKKNCEDEQL